ncbi:hypothetical protein OA161_00460 [Candidatus Pelagibacter sp.]|nr:hypothetical protein [Candidatus Pelagibacter sp.]
MKIYTKIILDKNNKLLKEEFFEYNGKIENAMGIHYDYKSTKGVKLMEKQAKREKKLAERKAKREKKLGEGGTKKAEDKTQALDPSVALSLDDITNPNKG